LHPNRDQNFGINELAAVQDVRNDYSLQDLDSASEATSSPQSASTFKEKGKCHVPDPISTPSTATRIR